MYCNIIEQERGCKIEAGGIKIINHQNGKTIIKTDNNINTYNTNIIDIIVKNDHEEYKIIFV